MSEHCERDAEKNKKTEGISRRLESKWLNRVLPEVHAMSSWSYMSCMAPLTVSYADALPSSGLYLFSGMIPWRDQSPSPGMVDQAHFATCPPLVFKRISLQITDHSEVPATHDTDIKPCRREYRQKDKRICTLRLRVSKKKQS